MVINIRFFIFLLLPVFTIAQKTYVPDDAFEQALINLDLDDSFDDSVYTSAVDTVTILYIPNEDIIDLTGIEDFIALTELFCHDNQLVHLDLSNNMNLFELNCNSNQLISLSVKNGNYLGLWYFTAVDNPSLFCVEVDNVSYAYANWLIDNQNTAFSTDCTGASIEDIYLNKRLVKVVDMLGREIAIKEEIKYSPIFYIYNDGTVERRIVIE